MSFYHLSPSIDTNINNSFSSFNSNINDLSLFYLPWSNITYKPTFNDVAYSGNYFSIYNIPDLSIYASNTDLIYTSNYIFSNLNNLIHIASNNYIYYTNFIINQETSNKWSLSNNVLYITNNYLNVGIGTSFTTHKLNVNGSINTTNDYFINNITLSNIFITSNYYNIDSNKLFNELSNLTPNIKNFNNYWSSNSNFIYTYSNIGIGTYYGSYNLNISNSINASSFYINHNNISNIFINSNNLNSTSNSIISHIDYKFLASNSIHWSNYPNNSNIFLNTIGNIGIGTTNPIEKVHIIGNILINGNMYPEISNIYDLGTSNNRWKDLYLSGNSIYLNDIVINSNNEIIEFKKNNELIALKTNEINLNSIILKNNNLNLSISNGNNNKYIALINNDSSNIIFSNVLNLTSNNLYSFTNNKFNNFNSDKVQLGNKNRFIIDDTYDRNLTLNSNLITSNIITSNLSVIGNFTTLYTNLYQTEQLQVFNDTTTTSMIIKQLNINQNIAEFFIGNYPSLFIHKSSNIGIGTSNPNYKLDVNGSINTSNLFINNNNINTFITSNDTYNSNIIYILSSNQILTASNTNFIYSSNTSNLFNFNKQDKLTFSTILLGDGNIITNINYNNLNNKPDLSSFINNSYLISTSNILFSNLSNQDFKSSNSNFNYINTQLSIITPNLSQWTTNQNKVYIYNSNIGIGTTNPNYNLDVNGIINTNELLLKGNNISNIFITSNNFIFNSNNLFFNLSNQDFNSSNANINYTNSKVASIITGQNPWSINGNNLYYNNGNIGIGSDNPNHKLVINNGDLNINGNLRLSNLIVPFSQLLNTNIITSNGSFNYIPNSSSYGYIAFLNSGSITFPQATTCDVLMVGAGGNGGFGAGSGGGGAGEVIYYPNSNFNSGTYNIQVGYSSFNSNNRISAIRNTNELMIAKGGGDGKQFNIIENLSLINISGTNDYYISFTNIGSTSIILNQVYTCDIFMIGGGGGGGFNHAGGGGAGAYYYGTNISLSAGTYEIFVGSGGLGGIYNNRASTSGSNSYIKNTDTNTTILLVNGGARARNYGEGSLTGLNGGCGSGAHSWNEDTNINTILIGGLAINTGTNGTGFNGGNAIQNFNGRTISGGGGGGIGGNGYNANDNNAGNGGNALSINITGTNMVFGGGGGGGSWQSQGDSGGNGGGANGIIVGGAGNGGNAVANTGSGGGGGAQAFGSGGNGSSGIVIIRFKNIIINNLIIGGSGGGGYLTNSGSLSGSKWNASFSYVNSGFSGTSIIGGNGGSALITSGFTENITGSNLIVGVGGLGASSTSLPILKYNYGSGGDGNGGLGTSGIVIIKVPLNLNSTKFDGLINYSNIFNRPQNVDLINSSNLINIGFNNQINFPMANTSWANEWFLYMGTAPTGTSNSFIFHHLNTTSKINSKWWFNGTQTSTNAEISDIRIKKEILSINNPIDKLMSLNPVSYYLCDEKDYLNKYGILAQEVESNLDLKHLVYTDNDYIANIYTNAIYVKEFINNIYIYKLITQTKISNKVNINDELKLLLNNIDVYNPEIIIEETPYHNRYKKRYVKIKSIIDETTIEIYEEILDLEEEDKEQLFIYGKKVADFKKLDYSSLYSLNIKATQELIKLLNEQEIIIQDLEMKIIELENK